MTCQNCQEREATVVVTKVVGEQHQATHLCPGCATTLNGPGGVAITIQTMTVGQTAPAVSCPGCGKSFADFRKTGLFGCARCYDAFDAHLERLFRRVQGVAGHRPAQTVPDLDGLERALQEAVKQEAFEEAAALRDRIRRARTERAPSP
jgi:protein arginine kinase activator